MYTIIQETDGHITEYTVVNLATNQTHGTYTTLADAQKQLDIISAYNNK